MKKILYLLIVFAMTFSTVSYAKTDIEGNKAEFEDAVNLLSSIKVMQKLGNESDVVSSEVSRIEFATYIAAMLGYNIYEVPSKNYFKDIPDDHWGLQAVNIMAELGLMSGNGTQMFYPDEPVSLAQATKILLTITGYTQNAISKGGYPQGYIAVASSQHIIPAVINQDKLTLKEVVLLLYNAVNMPMYEPIAFSDNFTTYKKSEYSTILSNYHNIHIAEGQLKSVDTMSLGDEYAVGLNEIKIDDTTYICTNVDLSEYLGMNVKVYYKMSRNDTYGTVVYNLLNVKRNDVVEISSDNFKDFDENTGIISYYEKETDTRAKTAKISKGAIVVLNGRQSVNDIKSAISVTNGEIKLIKTNGNEFDVVIAKQYNYINIAKVDSIKKVIYDAYDNTLSLDLNDESGDKYVKIMGSSGMKQEFSTLKEGNAIQYLESEDKEYVYVYVCDTAQSGVVKGFSEKGGKYTIKIDDAEYRVSKTFADKAKFFPYAKYADNSERKLKIGDNISFVLDSMGKIVELTLGKTEAMQFGYLLSAVESDGMDSYVSLKIFGQNNAMNRYVSSSKMTIDGKKCNTATEIQEALLNKEGNFYQAVRYRLDEDGKVKEIDTVKKTEKETDYSLKRTNEGKDELHYSWVGLLGVNNVVDATNTVVIHVPQKQTLETADDKEYVVGGKSSFKDQKKYNVEVYKCNPDTLTAELVILHETYTADIGYSNGLMLVDEVVQVVNSDGMVVDCIRGNHNGQYKEVLINDDYETTGDAYDYVPSSKIDSGDIITYATNSLGEIIRIRLLFDYSIAENNSDNTFFNNAVNPQYALKNPVIWENFTAGYKISYGYVSRKEGNLWSWSYFDLGKDDEIYNVTTNNNLAKVMIYDSSKKDEKVYTGSLEDITSYEQSATEFSKVFTMAHNGQIYSIVFYI